MNQGLYVIFGSADDKQTGARQPGGEIVQVVEIDHGEPGLLDHGGDRLVAVRIGDRAVVDKGVVLRGAEIGRRLALGLAGEAAEHHKAGPQQPAHWSAR